MNDNCKGCSAFKFTGCSYGNSNKKGTCPCTQCIVKGMCIVSCDDYDEWSDLAFKGRVDEYKQ